MNRKRAALVLTTVVLAASGLTACGDNRECLDWETQHQWVNVPNGKGGFRLVYQPVTYCERYAKESPDGEN